MAETDPPRKTYGFKAKDFDRVNAPTDGARPPPPENDVHAIQEQIRQREIDSGMDNLAPVRPKKSRRSRDYWTTVAGTNVLLVAVIIGSGGNLVVGVYAASGVILLTIGLTWTMWFVMDDY